MTELIAQQLDYIYFLCGLAYCILAFAAFSIVAKKMSPLPWQWIGLFGLFNCIGSWLGLLALQNWSALFPVLQTLFTCLGLASLVEFGRRISSMDRLALKGLWIYPLLLAPGITVAFFNVNNVPVTLSAMLSAGILVTVLPTLRRILSSKEIFSRNYVLTGAVLLTALVVTQPFTTLLFPHLPFLSQTDYGNIYWLEALLLLQAACAALLTTEFRFIYDALMERVQAQSTITQSSMKWVIAFVLGGIAIGGFFVTWAMTSLWDKEIKQEFIIETSVAALSVDPANIKSMTGTLSDLGSIQFQRLYEQQRMMSRADQTYRWTYLLIQREGRLIILTDSEPAMSSERAAVMEYVDASPEISPVFNTGKPVVIGPYTDQWGRWVTALAPIMDTYAEKVVALQGIDMAADKYYALLGFKRLEAIFSLWLLAIFALIAYYYERKLREQLALVEKSETRYSAIVENAMDGILIVQDGIIKYANGSAAGIFGRTQSEITGHPATDFIHSEDHPLLVKKLADRMAGRPIDTFTPLRALSKNGDIHYIEATGVIIDFEGKPADLAQIRDVTERRLAEQAIRQSNYKLEAIIDSLPDATFVVDHERKIIAWNRAMEDLTGTKKADMLGKGNYEYAIPLYGERRPVFIDVVFTNADEKKFNYENVSRDGDRAYAEAYVPGVLGGRGGYLWGTAALLRDENGKVIGAIETIRDMSDRKELEQELQASNEKLKEWLGQAENRAQDVVLIGEMVQWIDSCDSFKEAAKVAGHYLQQLFKYDNGFLAFVDPDKNILEAHVLLGKPEGDTYFTAEECWGLRMGKMHTGDGSDTCRVCRHLGENYSTPYVEVPLTAQGQPLGLLCIQHAPAAGLNSKEVAGWLQARKEIASRAAEPLSLALANTRLRATLREQANRDALTGLYNRRYMEDVLERELHRARREQKNIGFIMGDIDHFKLFNDKYGHEAGDIMLKTVAATIKSSIRAEDIACRFGGEEFLIILPSAGLADTQERAAQIHERVRKISFDYGENHIGNMSISMGISVFPGHGDNQSSLIASADMALYTAKKHGRDRICQPL